MNVKYLRNRPSNSEQSTAQRLDLAVYNTGNYFFEDAVERQVRSAKVVYEWEDIRDADVLVLSMANFLSPHNDLGAEAALIENSNISRIVMIGAGAQCETYKDSLNLTSGTERFVRVISERSKSVGVRGEFTASALERIGIKNVDVIGCPSLYYNLIPEAYINTELEGRKNIAVHSTPHGGFRDRIAQLWAFGVEREATYVVQSERSLALCMADEGSDRDQASVHFMSEYYRKSDLPASILRSWLMRGKIFFDCPSWIGEMKNYAYAIGTRFHGNVAATLAGRPSLTLIFDSRTRELCEYFDLPHAFLADDKCIGEKLLWDGIAKSRFTGLFPARYAAYRDFLEKNGLEHNLSAPARNDPLQQLCIQELASADNVNLRSIMALIQASIDADLRDIPVEAVKSRLAMDRSPEERRIIDNP